jgi:hypothetical protein
MMESTNQLGRHFVCGKPLSDDLRDLIVTDLKECVVDQVTGRLSNGAYTCTSKKYKVSLSGVRKIWKKYCEDGLVTPRKQEVNRENYKKLTWS